MMIGIDNLVDVFCGDELRLSLMLLISIGRRFEHGIEYAPKAFGEGWVIVRTWLLTGV
jgi:hypothetical protein